ncbi:YlbE-like family protein [Bacillus sp. FJAT-45066]|uniref:YlbE-like family protein n=1 Tax=Bacillus sp. FJAT-45066 TaxID=2011010 RepID=UPI000BB88E19|nr:YlbE-like family protein [Bacillus sp. FJAT-45066]
MRKEVFDYIQKKKTLQNFIREQPIWYRKLSRNPEILQDFELASMYHYKQTIPHKVQKFQDSVQMASMMVHMFHTMKNMD